MKKLAIILLAVLLCASPAWAAITSVGNLGSATSISSDTTLVITLSAALGAGNCAVVAIANDNLGSSDGDNNDVTGVVDSTGANTWSQLAAEYTYAEGGAGNGANVVTFSTKAVSEVAISGTITITFASNVTSKAARAWEYTCGTALEFVSGSQQNENANGADNGSLAISGLSSQEYLFLRVMGRERDSTTDITPTASHTSWGDVTASTAADASSMRLDVEEIILTGTGDTSDPTFPSPGSSDGASFLIAVRETVTATTRPIAPFIFQ